MSWTMLGISQWIMYGTFAVAAVVCIGVVARAVWVPADVRRRCCCGGCGYPLADVASGRCPECGGALNKVGVTTPAMAVRLRGSLGWALLAWTTLFALVAGPVWSIVEMSNAIAASMAWTTSSAGSASLMTPLSTPRQALNEQVMLVPNSTAGPGDKQDFRIDCTVNATYSNMDVDSADMQMMLRVNGETNFATLDLDKGRGTYEILSADRRKLATGAIESLDAAAIKQWFEAAGVETKSAAGEGSRRDALKIAKMSMTDPGGLDAHLNGPGGTDPGSLIVRSRSSTTGPGGMSFPATPAVTTGVPVMPSPWTPGVVAGAVIGAVVYLAGVVGITWRNRRLLA